MPKLKTINLTKREKRQLVVLKEKALEVNDLPWEYPEELETQNKIDKIKVNVESVFFNQKKITFLS